MSKYRKAGSAAHLPRANPGSQRRIVLQRKRCAASVVCERETARPPSPTACTGILVRSLLAPGQLHLLVRQFQRGILCRLAVLLHLGRFVQRSQDARHPLANPPDRRGNPRPSDNRSGSLRSLPDDEPSRTRYVLSRHVRGSGTTATAGAIIQSAPAAPIIAAWARAVSRPSVISCPVQLQQRVDVPSARTPAGIQFHGCPKCPPPSRRRRPAGHGWRLSIRVRHHGADRAAGYETARHCHFVGRRRVVMLPGGSQGHMCGAQRRYAIAFLVLDRCVVRPFETDPRVQITT